jgi:hypothetical protein
MFEDCQGRWLDRNPFALLTRHFLGRFFDNELVSAGGDMTLSLTQILALLPVPGTILSLYYLCMKYAFLIARTGSWRQVDSWSDRCFFISFSMIMMGLASVLCWDALFPDHKDHRNLVVLPLRLKTLFLAKVTSLLLFVVLLSVLLNLGSAILFPLAATMREASWQDSLRFLAAHFISVVAAGGFMFFVLLALQGGLMNVLSPHLFQKASAVVQSLLLILFLSSFLVLSDLIVSVRGSDSRLWAILFVPAWFTALYDHLLAIKPAHAVSLSWRFPVAGLTSALVLSAGFYILSYGRYLGRFVQAESSGASRMGLSRMIVKAAGRVLARQPEETAGFDFVTATLMRSRRHLLVVGACLGTGLAFCFAGIFILVTRAGAQALYEVNLTLLAVPAYLSCFLLGGTRFAFALPAELPANWIFRTGFFRLEVYWRGVRHALSILFLVPIFLGTLFLFTFFWGWSTGWRLCLLQGVAAVILMEWLFRDFSKVPFTCSYLPGSANVKLRWPLYVIGCACYIFVPGALCLFVSSRPWAWLLAVSIGGSVISRLLKTRRQFLENLRPVYEEQPEPEVLKLDLSLPGVTA